MGDGLPQHPLQQGAGCVRRVGTKLGSAGCALSRIATTNSTGISSIRRVIGRANITPTDRPDQAVFGRCAAVCDAKWYMSLRQVQPPRRSSSTPSRVPQ